MTVHFSPARTPETSILARVFMRRVLRAPANDNGEVATQNTLAGNKVLQDSLRHFARYGLHAAANAREQAEIAFFEGDREGYDSWLAICRTLDRRLAEEFVRQAQSR